MRKKEYLNWKLRTKEGQMIHHHVQANRNGKFIFYTPNFSPLKNVFLKERFFFNVIMKVEVFIKTIVPEQ